MKKILFTLFLGGTVLTAGAQGTLINPETSGTSQAVVTNTATRPLRLTLEDCLEFAYSNNYNRESIKLNEEARQDQYKQSKMERLPDLSASVSESLNHNQNNSSSWDGSYGLNSSIILYQGGNISGNIEKNKLMTEQAEYQTQQYDNDLTVQILQAFLTALGNEELLKYQQAVLNASEEQMKQGKIRYEAGEIIESDYLLLQAQYANDKNNIVETTINRDNSLLALKSLLSIDPLQPLEIIYPDADAIDQMSLLPGEEEVLERSLATMPDMQISQYNVEIAEAGLKISKSGYYPTISLNGGIGSGHQNNFTNFGTQIGDRFNAQVGISVSIPLFNKGRTKSQVNQSRIALEQAELEQKQTELTLRQNILQEYRNVVSAESKYKSSQVKELAYGSSFDAYRAQYEAGSITTVDLLQQQNNYISAMNDYIQSKYGFMLKRKVLDVYMGEKITM